MHVIYSYHFFKKNKRSCAYLSLKNISSLGDEGATWHWTNKSDAKASELTYCIF